MDKESGEDRNCTALFASERVAEQPQLKFWTKPVQAGLDTNYGGYIYGSVLHKKGKRLKTWVARRYCLYENVLIYCGKKNKAAIKGVLNLEFIKCNFYSRAQKKRFSFVLTTGASSVELFTDDQKIFEEWQRHLRGRTIMDDYHAKYKTGKLIGKGSYGKVFLARDISLAEKPTEKSEVQLEPASESLGSQFAVKMVEKSRIKGRSKDMLLNEIKILKGLEHENITKLYEIHEVPHSIYLLMNVIEGGELMNHMKSKGFYSEADCAQILKKLLEVVDYIQSKGIIHRDLKPENILLKDRNDMSSVVIADFGLSCYTNDEIMRNLRCGTPGYVAPEILKEKKINENLDKIDVFSLGCIFYKLLTGNSPFFATSHKEIVRLNKECNINYESFLLSHVSAQAKSLLERMLEKDPSKRISVKDALDHEFFNQSELDLAENIINIDKLVSMHCSSNIFDVKGIKDKIHSSGILFKMSLQSVGSFYACPLPMINGKISTLADDSDEGNKSPSKNGPQVRTRLSSFGGPEGNSPSNQNSNHNRISLGILSTNAVTKLSMTYSGASPLHRMAVMKLVRTNDNSPALRTQAQSQKQVQKGDGFSEYVEQFKPEAFELHDMGCGSENFDDVDEEFDIFNNIKQLSFTKLSHHKDSTKKLSTKALK